jgi:hypothetical protein
VIGLETILKRFVSFTSGAQGIRRRSEAMAGQADAPYQPKV